MSNESNIGKKGDTVGEEAAKAIENAARKPLTADLKVSVDAWKQASKIDPQTGKKS